MKWKIAAVSATAAFILLLVIVLGVQAFRSAFGMRSLNSAAIVTQVQRLNQLTTVKYSIQRVVGLREPKVPVGEESLLIMVQGEALAGVDLSKLRAIDVSSTGKQAVEIALPPAQLFNVFLDEKQTKVWDHEITWWTPWVPMDPDIEHKARMQALDDVRKTAMQMGILDQAQTNAEVSIRDLLAAFNLSVKFRKRPLD